MTFFNEEHPFYCGIDLHARTMYVCIIDNLGNKLVHCNLKTDPETFLEIVAPYGDQMVVGVECVFCWYWLADLCRREQIRFVLGHALYMKAIHGGKTKNPSTSLRAGCSMRSSWRACCGAATSRSPTPIRLSIGQLVIC